MSAALSWFGLKGSNESNLVVSKLLIHPIKSCCGISIQEGRYTPNGMENDRTFMLIDAKTHKAVTAREFPQLVLVTPKVKGDQLVVSFPEDSGFPTFNVPLRPTKDMLERWELVKDAEMWRKKLDGYIVQFSEDTPYRGFSPSEIFSSYLSHDVLLVFEGPTHRAADPTESHPKLHETSTIVYQDGYPLLIFTEESFHQLQKNLTKAANGEAGWTDIGGFNKEAWQNRKLQMERFRPNIILSGSAGPFEEDDWSDIYVGSQTDPIQLVSRSTRCQLPNVDPQTGEMDKAVPYKILAKDRRVDPANPYTPCFGSNASPTASGVIRVGDRVVVSSRFKRSAPAGLTPGSQPSSFMSSLGTTPVIACLFFTSVSIAWLLSQSK